MEVNRVTRALRKRLNSIESDVSVRPNTPKKDLEIIQENVTVLTPTRRTRQNSIDTPPITMPIKMPPITPGRRVTRRSSITAETASPAVASPVRRTSRRLASEDNKNEIINTKPNPSIMKMVVEEHELENSKENDNKQVNKRVTRSSSKSPQQIKPYTSLMENDGEKSLKKNDTSPKKNLSQRLQTKSATASVINDSESDDDIQLNTLKYNDDSKIISNLPNISKSINENSVDSTQNGQSIERTPKNITIDQSLEERQRLKSVTFNDSDENINTPKRFPKTPVVSKSFIYVQDLESSKELNEKFIKNINNMSNENDENLIDDNSTKDISNEKKSPNLKNKNSETPYKELKLKDSVMSSSTPINAIELNIKGKKINPIVRLSKNFNSVIEKSKEKLNITPANFSTSWDQAIRGKASEKIDKLNFEGNVEESIKINESNKKIKKSNKVIPSSDDDDDNDDEEDVNEKCEYIDNEADEMDGEESMDEEERQYLKENEIPLQEEILGSEDSDSVEEEDEEPDDYESFIVSDESEQNKILSTDTEDELFEKDKSNKKNYKRITIPDSDDSKSNEEENTIKSEICDKSFTTNNSNSVITITDGDDILSAEYSDEVFSNGKKSICNISDLEVDSLDHKKDASLKNNRLSLEKIAHLNSSRKNHSNFSQISGIESLSNNEDFEDDKGKNFSLNVSKNNKSLNQSVKKGKKTPDVTDFEADETQISQTSKLNDEQDQEFENHDQNVSKSKNSSINKNKTANFEEFEEPAIKENKMKSPKKNKSFICNSSNEEDGQTIANSSLVVKSPKHNISFSINDKGEENHSDDKSSTKFSKNRNSSINVIVGIADESIEFDRNDKTDEQEKVVNKSLKSPKTKNLSFNQSKVLAEKENRNSESEEELEKHIKNQNKCVVKSPKNKNTSINNSHVLNSVDKNDTLAYNKSDFVKDAMKMSTMKSPNNSLTNKKLNNTDINKESVEKNEVSEGLESPINRNTSRNRDLITTKNVETIVDQKIHSQSDEETDSNNSDEEEVGGCKNINDFEKVEIQREDFDSDINEDDDKDYVPEDDKESNSNSSIISENENELKAELEKINEEKNISKSKLSFSFTSVTDYRPFEEKKKLSKSFTTGNSKISVDNCNNSDDASPKHAVKNDEKITPISENDLSETEELEKLKSNEFKLKQSNRKSMNELKNKNLILSSYKSRHSLGSTHVNVEKEIFNDLREKLNKSNNNESEDITKTSLVDNDEKQHLLIDSNLNKNLVEKEKNNVIDGNFNNVSYILNRCDEILEAANQAKREAKLQNKLNKNDKLEKMKTKKKKYEESSNDSNDTEQIQEFEINLKDAEIKKALKAREMFMIEKNAQKKIKQLASSIESRFLPNEILQAMGDEPKIKKRKFTDAKIAQTHDVFLEEQGTQKIVKKLTSSTESRSLPDEILEAVTDEPKIKKKKFKDSENISHSKYQSESPERSNIEIKSKTSNKLKRKIYTTENITTSELSKKNSNLIKSASGIFIEQPITPPRKNKNDKNAKIISKQETRSGTVYEEPITPDSKKIINGFKECPITPKAIGFKVRSILSAGQKEPPLMNLEKNLKKRKRKNISEPITSLPKQVWSRSGVFIETKLSGKKLILDESVATDFYVMPLEVKRTKSIKTQQYGVNNNNNALEFKKNALMNSKVRRETSKELLQRKERKNIYNKF